MRFWIICSGESSAALPARCTAEELQRLWEERLAATAPRPGLPRVEANGRPLYEPLLDEIPPALPEGGKSAPLWRWELTNRMSCRRGRKSAPESAKQSRARADELIDKLERRGEDCILISHPRMIAVLLDRLRVRGYVAQRTGIGRVKPFEQMLLSRRGEHCGGCAHNCLLSNPGCNVGRDKAKRAAG